MAFRGFQLHPGKKADIAENDENGLIHLSNACLASGDKAQLFCTVNGMRLIVAVFEKNGVEQQKLNLRFDSSSDECFLEAVGGEVHVTGFFEDMEDQDMDNMGEDDLKALMAEMGEEDDSAEDENLDAEQQKKEIEQQKAEEQKKAEQQKKADEQKKAEQQKKADELKKAQQQKKAEEQKKAEQQKKAEEQKKAELAKKAAEKKNENADFIAAKKFAGAKAGYVFKKDKKGLGYYKDTYVAPKGLKRKAEDSTPSAAKKILTLAGNVKAEITKAGSGPKATRGKQVTVKYDGRLTNGKRFDRGSIRFRLGGGEVIKGWDVGVEGMLVGEKRKLLIPPKFAYGARGAPPDIPPNATLAFDVELLRL